MLKSIVTRFLKVWRPFKRVASFSVFGKRYCLTFYSAVDVHYEWDVVL